MHAVPLLDAWKDGLSCEHSSSQRWITLYLIVVEFNNVRNLRVDYYYNVFHTFNAAVFMFIVSQRRYFPRLDFFTTDLEFLCIYFRGRLVHYIAN